MQTKVEDVHLDSFRDRVLAIQRKLYRCGYCREERTQGDDIVLVHVFPTGTYICYRCVSKALSTFDGPDADETLHQETLCTVCGYSKNTPVYKRSPLVICKDCVELAAEAVRVSGVPSESDSDDDILTKIVELDATFADRLPRPEGGLFVQRLSKSQLSQFRSEEKFDKSWSEYLTVEEIDHRLEELATLDFLY